MGFFAKSLEERLRRDVAKLRRKNQLEEALKLELQLCQGPNADVAEWRVLADLAREAKQSRVEVAARVQLCKLGHAGPDEWIAVAALAGTASLFDEQVDALFRAADGCAIRGECHRAVALCEQVLALAPSHGAAKRIHGMMTSRLAPEPPPPPPPTERAGQPEPPKTDLSWPACSVAGATGNPAATHIGPGPLDSEPGPPPDTAPGVGPGPWQSGETLEGEKPKAEAPKAAPAGASLRSEVTVNPALVDFVCRQQPWPSVLDTTGLTFVGRTDTIAPALLAGAHRVHLPASSLACRQGIRGQIIYCVESGRVRLQRVRGVAQDLGQVTAGEFFGEVGAIAGVPCSATATVEEETELRVITRQHLRNELPSKSVSGLIQALRKWYLEVAIRICSPLGLMDEETRARVTASSRWALFEPGQHLAERDKPSKLTVVVVGIAQVTRGGISRLGFLTTGDTVGEMASSPVTVTAQTRLFAAVIEAEDVARLPPKAKAYLETRAEVCNQIIAKLEGSRTVGR